MRPPAYPYFFIHEELVEVLRRQGWPGLREGVRSGAIRPEIIDYDDLLRALPREFQDLVARSYAPTGVGTLWRRVPTGATTP
jgi:hypothetical protein